MRAVSPYPCPDVMTAGDTDQMQPFTFNTTKSLVFRPGAAAEMAEVAGATVGPRILFVTDPGLTKLGLYDAALASLRGAGRVCAARPRRR